LVLQNLDVGQRYQIQLYYSDFRSGSYKEYFYAGDNGSISTVFRRGTTVDNWSFIGTFTADSDRQRVLLVPNGTRYPEGFENHDPGNSAYVLSLASGPQCDLNNDGAVDAADAGIMFGDWGASPNSKANKNGDGFVDAADAAVMFAEWTGDPDPPGTNAATAEYNSETGQLTISSAGAVNVFVQSAASKITPLNPPPVVPVGLLTNNASRVGITNLGPINTTNFSFGSIGAGLAMSDLKLVYTPALGQKGIEIAAGSAGFRYIPEPASCGLLAMGMLGYFAARRRS